MPNKKEIERLLRYRMCLNRLKGLGFENVFSYFLAEEIGVSPEQIRKDLSNFNIRGRKKSGYDIDQLLTDIEGLIGKDTIKKIVIVGMGNIGTALAQNSDFEINNMEIVAGFDINPNKLKKKLNIPLYNIDKLDEIVKAHEVTSAIISVQAVAAQQVCSKLVSLNIKAIMNFAPIILKVPDDVIVNNVNLCNELISTIYLAEKK
jgi:redox-sensing transcriptional repressor